MSGAVNVLCRGGCGRIGPRANARWTWADDCGDASADAAVHWPWCPACLRAERAAQEERDALRLARVLMEDA